MLNISNACNYYIDLIIIKFSTSSDNSFLDSLSWDLAYLKAIVKK